MDVGMTLISSLDGIGSEAAYERASINLCCLDSSEKKFFALMKSYGESDSPKETIDGADRKEFAEEMIVDAIKLHIILGVARLYKEGDIRAPLVYGFTNSEGKLKRIIKSMPVRTVVSQIPFRIEKTEAHDFNEFLKSTRNPEENAFMKRPYKCFEDSFATRSSELTFTSLVTGLESIFHRRGVQRIGAEIARNCATLIGVDKDDAEVIESKLKTLYNKRSLVLHEAGAIEEEDIPELRDYLRRSIRKVLKLGLSANQVK